MAKILYGIQGCGLGHTFRSKAIIDELIKKHDIMIISADKAFKLLSKHYKNVHEVEMPLLEYNKARLSLVKTTLKNIGRIPKTISSLVRLNRLIKKYRPDIAITDFEPLTNIMAKYHSLPLIAIDNISVLKKCNINISFKDFFAYLYAYITALCAVNLPRYYLLVTFFDAKAKSKNVLLFPPVVRKEVLQAKVSKKGHIIVYQTGHNYGMILPILKQMPRQKFIIYGSRECGRKANLFFKPISIKPFINDLASCKAVITNGGFTLVSEAIALGKPILSIPIRGQFEQNLNAKYIDKLGIGKMYTDFKKEYIEEFLSNLKFYEKNLKKHRRVGNKAIIRKVNEIIRSVKK